LKPQLLIHQLQGDTNQSRDSFEIVLNVSYAFIFQNLVPSIHLATI
jgi:hypothetical protein